MIPPSNQDPGDALPPEIISDEEAPFDSEPTTSEPGSFFMDHIDRLSEELPTKPSELEKFKLGSSTLGWCLFLMLFCILLSLWKPDNELVKNGFEAFKLIVMTVLGYIFGSNDSKSN